MSKTKETELIGPEFQPQPSDSKSKIRCCFHLSSFILVLKLCPRVDKLFSTLKCEVIILCICQE